MAKHWIKFVQFFDAAGNDFARGTDLFGKIFLLMRMMRQEFMQRRIKQTNGSRVNTIPVLGPCAKPALNG